MMTINTNAILGPNWKDADMDMWASDHATEISIWSLPASSIPMLCREGRDAILAEDEIGKSNRFHQKAHADRFKAGRILLRLLAGKLLDCDPRAIEFERSPSNKPRIVHSSDEHSVEFNISYAAHHVLIAMDKVAEVGVDIERINRDFDFESMLQPCFSKKEITYITDAPVAVRHLRFFSLWTRKEAILKATGIGIGEHLPQVEVLDGTTEANGTLIGDASAEQFHIHTFQVNADYVGSLATERPDAQIGFYQLP